MNQSPTTKIVPTTDDFSGDFTQKDISIGKLSGSADGFRQIANWLQKRTGSTGDFSFEGIIEETYDGEELLKRTIKFKI